ncbi:MAG: M48 family metalloprotease [Calditrichia bacterium]
MFHKTTIHFRKYFALVVLLALVISCAVNPVTGKRELMLLSEAEEIQLGKETDVSIVQTYGIYPDEELTNYVRSIGQRMAKLSHRPNLNFEFKVMDTPVINAFAVPGGFVYITRGILAYLNSEAEFAGVVGHEIGHVTARHSAKQYSRAQLAQLGLGLGSILSEDFRQYAGLAQFGVGMLFLKFSRDNERQSDDLGVEYATKAGYDATYMANFFETLERMSPGEDRSGLPGWFSTHPNPADRVEAIRRQAQAWQQKVGIKNLKVGREEFLRHIDGIVFGEDPRQGYVEDNAFYHPELKFQFPVPLGWTVNNTPAQVQMTSPEQDAAIIFTLETATSPTEAANKFISNSKATVVSRSSLTISGFPAHRAITDITSSQGVLRVLSYFIQKDQNIYVFHGFTGQSSFPNFQPVFQSTPEQFKHLSDPNKINVAPDRIRIKKVPRSGTVREALIALGVADDKLEAMALLNGKLLTDTVEANTLLKVIEYGRK